MASNEPAIEAKTLDLPKGKEAPPPTPTTSPPSSPSLRSSSGSGSAAPPGGGDDPTGTIVVSVTVMIGSALVKDVYHGTPTIRPVVTGMMLGGALLILATFAPTLAKMLAIIGMFGALMTNGAELTQVAGNIGQQQKGQLN